jgi:SSS family solute:Na+ symporter
LSGLLAAVVSTTGSILLIISVNVSNNIVKRIVPGITEKKRISVSRWSVVLVGVVGIVIGNYANSIISVMQDVSAPYISAILPLIITAFFWKKATFQGARATIAVAVVTSTTWWALKQPFGIHHIVFSLVCSILTMVVVSTAVWHKTAQKPIESRGVKVSES